MKQVYQSEDGKIFSTAAECSAYENQLITTHYYRYVPKKYTGVPICYSVKIPKQHEELSNSLFVEFIRHNVGVDIQRENTSYTLEKVLISQLYTIERVNADVYNKAVTQKELYYNPLSSYLELTNKSSCWSNKSSFKTSKLDDMMKTIETWNTTPVKALTTDDFKSLKIDETFFFGIDTSDPLKNFKIKNTWF